MQSTIVFVVHLQLFLYFGVSTKSKMIVCLCIFNFSTAISILFYPKLAALCSVN